METTDVVYLVSGDIFSAGLITFPITRLTAASASRYNYVISIGFGQAGVP